MNLVLVYMNLVHILTSLSCSLNLAESPIHTFNFQVVSYDSVLRLHVCILYFYICDAYVPVHIIAL
jgi:hypothetical protein